MPVFSADRKPLRVPAACTHAAAFLLCLRLAWAPVSVSASDSYEAGTAARLSGDYGTAWRIPAPLADAGDARAQNDVGVMFGRGLGVAQSYRGAAMLIERAPEQGFPEAQRNLGSIYEHGSGLPPGSVLAYAWYG